jgi:CubicO group peptidase (beta-lactamase class C family)
VLEKWRAPGVAIAIVSDGKVMLAKGYGVRDLTTGKPMTERTLFSIASITKQFTALSAGLLVDDGQMEFDAPIRRYIAAFETSDPLATNAITIRDLLSHRSGLPELTFLERSDRRSRQEIVAGLRHIEGLAPLRSQWIYSNTGYGVVARAVELAAGVPWEQFVDDRIFEPLGMRRTTFSYEQIRGDSDQMRGTMWVNGKTVPVPITQPSGLSSAGGIYSTAEDLGKWMLLHLSEGQAGGGQIVTPATLRELHRTSIPTPWGSAAPEVVPIGYGMGWFTELHRGEQMVMHGGNNYGVSTLLGLLPQRGVGVVVLTNQNSSLLTYPVMRAVFDRFMGRRSAAQAHPGRSANGRAREKPAPVIHSPDMRVSTTTPGTAISRYATKARRSRSSGRAMRRRWCTTITTCSPRALRIIRARGHRTDTRGWCDSRPISRAG